MNKKQTAVEWLMEQYSNENYGIEIGEQAKEMEREQHSQTWDNALAKHEERGKVLMRSFSDFDEYYNKK